MIKGLLGIIDKMRIEVFKTPNYAETPYKTIFVQLNPEKYSTKHTVEFCEEQAMGTPGAALTYNKNEGEDVNFEFFFDSSGVVPLGKIMEGKGTETLTDDIGTALQPVMINPLAKAQSVEGEVKEFKNLLMGYNQDTHQTNYLKLLWGNYTLNCRLKSMEIEYSLFRGDGLPVRAKVKCNFKETVVYKTTTDKNKTSPDLTHQRTANMNDKLTLLSEDIYQNDNYYIDVAKSNKLLSFKQIVIGQKLNFPPIK